MRRKRIPWIRKLSFVLIISGFCFIFHVLQGYEKGKEEYEVLNKEYTMPVTEAEDDGHRMDEYMESRIGELPETDIGTEDYAAYSIGHAQQTVAEVPEDAPGRLSVDFEKLLKINPDVVGWISVPAVDISYPVLQGNDNDSYLHQDLYGQYLYAGSIFIDCKNGSDFSDDNTIIYGHNMLDGSMFARLKEFREKSTIDRCRYIWVLTPGAEYLYEIFSIQFTSPSSNAYVIRFDDQADFEQWKKEMMQISDPAVKCGDFDYGRIITLSTCTETAMYRLVVQGKLIWQRSL